MSDEKPTTKRSLIDKDYPDVEADAPTSQGWRTLEAHAYREERDNKNGNALGLGIDNGSPMFKGLGLYPNILLTGGAREMWGFMPSTTTYNRYDQKAFRDETKNDYGIDTIFDSKNAAPLAHEAQDVAKFITVMQAPLKTLASYVDGGAGTMNYEEKEALMHCISVIGPRMHVNPELFTRFVNPLGCMGDVESYEGITAYFYDIANRLQHHSKHTRISTNDDVVHDLMYTGPTMGPYSSPGRSEKKRHKNIDSFFETNSKMDLPEAARLLGMAAKHWGIDKAPTQDDVKVLSDKVYRFHSYLFASKAVQLIKERAYGENDHQMLGIFKEDAEFLKDYAQGVLRYTIGNGKVIESRIDNPTQAERELMNEINNMLQPDAREYNEMQRLLKGGDGVSEPDLNKHRVYQYDMMREKYHAMNFLLENDKEGERLLFGH